MDYLESCDHPVYNLLVNDISSFVEEPGEISFGMLGTLESRSGKQPDNFETLRQNFRLLNTYINTYSKLSGLDERKPSKHVDYDDDDIETVLLNSWIHKLIEDCTEGSFLPYSLSKYKSTNLPLLADIIFNDPDFACDNLAEKFFPPEVFNTVEATIRNIHRLWRRKRKPTED